MNDPEDGVCPYCGLPVTLVEDSLLAVGADADVYCPPGAVDADDRVFPLHSWVPRGAGAQRR